MFGKSAKKTKGVFKKLTMAFLLASYTLQAPALQGVYSSSADEFLKKKEYPEILSTRFNTENIRFYYRDNPLKTLHKVGTAPMRVIRNEDLSSIRKAMALPFYSLSYLVQMPLFDLMVSRNKVASYAFVPNGEKKYINPVGDFSLNEFLAKMSQIKPLSKISEFHTINAPEDLVKVFKTFITAHEMRHCEQPKDWKSVRQENDSDVVAMQMLADAGYSQPLLEEAIKIILAVHAVSALCEEANHDTALSLQTGVAEREHNAAYDDVRHRVLDLLDKQGYRHFFTRISRDEKQYHATSFLLSSGEFPKGGDSERYATLYKWAFEYLDELSGGALIKHPDYAATFAQARGNEEKGVAPAFTSV